MAGPRLSGPVDVVQASAQYTRRLTAMSEGLCEHCPGAALGTAGRCPSCGAHWHLCRRSDGIWVTWTKAGHEQALHACRHCGRPVRSYW